MLKRALILTALVAGFSFAAAADANAAGRRIAQVRRVATRAVLTPSPVARRIVLNPVYRPAVYRAPIVYGPSVNVGFGYYGW
ncbi:MAG: hypothetical protein MK171_07190 [Pirellulales bacterium]|nr:hypothetical protein [Pirellulales bacterium]